MNKHRQHLRLGGSGAALFFVMLRNRKHIINQQTSKASGRLRKGNRRLKPSVMRLFSGFSADTNKLK